MGASPAGTLAADMPSISTLINRLDIPGPRDKPVKNYCAWQQSQVETPTLKVEYQKACDVIIQAGTDLELIHQDQDPDFLIKRGLKRPITRQVVGDIEYWAKKVKRA
jgi:hypothetical protein